MNLSMSRVITIKPKYKNCNPMPLQRVSSEGKFYPTQERRLLGQLRLPPANAKNKDNFHKHNGRTFACVILFQGPVQSEPTQGAEFPAIASVVFLGQTGGKFHLRKVFSPKQFQYFLIVFSATKTHCVI